MKIFLSILLTCISATCISAPSGRLLDAIRSVESADGKLLVGDGGRAIGEYQLHKCYVDEVNRILGERRYTYADRNDGAKSREMAVIYLSRWGRVYERQTGKPATDEVYAKIHNGHNYWRKSQKVKAAVERYWRKVAKEMAK